MSEKRFMLFLIIIIFFILILTAIEENKCDCEFIEQVDKFIEVYSMDKIN